MSLDIYLVDPITKETIESDVPHGMRGGTYQVGGTTEMYLNVTYNYSSLYYSLPFPEWKENGLRCIEGLDGASSIPLLQKAADALRDDADPDYWKATEGNAKRPLLQLISMAKMYPYGVWEIY